MFKKILVAEDIEIANYGIIQTLLNRNLITQEGIRHTQYCDKAFIELKKAQAEQKPFDLLITDLSFEKNGKTELLTSGYELINEARKIQENIKIIVYSIEDRVSKVRPLFLEKSINGYVCKDGHDASELIKAMTMAYKGQTYIPIIFKGILGQKSNPSLTDYQKKLLQLLAEGNSQKQVEKYFKKEDIKPNSISMIEKTLEKLRDDFNANSTSHLILILKDFGLL
ncbi:MAG: response regulator [Bacteroidota bacterium]